MAIQEITSPPMLDSTGQTMVTKLQSIASAINSNAGAISYDNTISGMTATKVQSAIDEVKGITDTISSSLTRKTNFYSKTSLISFLDASGESDNIYMGGVADKIKSNINNYNNQSTTNIYESNGGPAFGCIIQKVNNNYYSILMFSYHELFTGIGIFAYRNGNHACKKIGL